MPKVSVIVPNYNHAPYLRQRFDSIFNQTFQNFEVIILDDCSTDNSKEVIEEYRNRPQVSHIVYNETNSGSPFKQWAKGFDLAQGEYIWIAESDDWAEPTFLEELYDAHQKNNSLCLAFSNSLFVFPEKKEHRPIFSEDTCIPGKNFIIEEMLYYNAIVNASAVLFRKSCVPKRTSYLHYKTAGDYLFWVNICETGEIFYKNKCLNNFRKHSANTTELNLTNGILFEEELKVFQYIKSQFNLSRHERNYAVLKWLDRLNSLEENTTKKSLKIIRQAKKSWKKEISNPFLTQTLCYAHLLLLQVLPNSFSQKYPWTEPFKNAGRLGLLWKMLHLPKTNFRKWLNQ